MKRRWGELKPAYRVALLLAVAAVLVLLAVLASRNFGGAQGGPYANAESEFVALGEGVTAHLRDEGPRDGPVILLVHDVYGSLHAWDGVTKALRDDYRVVRVDLPGHGLTRAPDDYRPSLAAYSRFLEAIARKRGLTSFSLAGAGLGGDVVLTYALDHPRRVQKLAVAGASGWPPSGASAAQLEARIRARLTAGLAEGKAPSQATIDRHLALNRPEDHRRIIEALLRGRPDVRSDRRLARLRGRVVLIDGTTMALGPPSGTRLEDVASSIELVSPAGFGLAETSPDSVASSLKGAIGHPRTARLKANQKAIQAAATAACLCKRGGGKDCWTQFNRFTVGHEGSTFASACAPISVDGYCFGDGPDQFCVTAGYSYDLCTAEEAEAVGSLWKRTERSEGHEAANRKAAALATSIRRGGKVPPTTGSGACG